MKSVLRDQCFGRRLARTGAAHMVITRDASRVPTPAERVMFWRWRSGNPELGNVVFLRQPVPGCPQPETAFKPIEYVVQSPGAAVDAARSGQAAVPPDAAPARVSTAGDPIQPEETR